ncbi:hypothetical protein Q8A73_003520 [Channa argus]|nr:hypothetical protein Q8A73_003520 [Channa argus]
MSETLITACVSAATPASPVPTDYCGVLLPNQTCDIIVAHSLSEVQNGMTAVRVLNPSRDDIELHAGQYLEKNAPFQWTLQCQDAFNYLKHALSKPPLVAFPDFTVPFILYTDASCPAIGAVLSQKQEHQEKVIAYASHVLTKAERKWSTYDRELWAIVWAVRHFRHYLYKQPFVIITDHKPLLGLRKIPIDNDRTGRRARWALELDPFEWTVIHKQGHCHLNADAMSRRPADRDSTEQSIPCTLVASPDPELRHLSDVQPSCMTEFYTPPQSSHENNCRYSSSPEGGS